MKMEEMLKKTYLFLATLLLPLNAFSLTIDEAVNIALKNNPDIKMVKSKIRISDLTKKEKKRSNYGKLLLNGSYTHYNIPRTIAPIVPPLTSPIVTDENISSLGISYTVTLFSGFSNIEDIKIASIEKKVAENYLNLSKAQVAYNVRSIFLKILSLQENRKALSFYITALNRLKTDIKTGIKTGKRAEIDLLKVEAEIEKINAEIEKINGNIKILKATLALLLGKEKIEDKLSPVTLPIKKLPDSFTNTNINENPQIKIAELELEKSKKTVRKIKSSYFPTINFNAYYGKNFGGGESETLWQVGVSFNWLLYDFGSRKIKVEKALENSSISKIQIEKTKLSLIKELQEAKAKILSAKESLKSAEKEVTLTEKVKKIEKVRYETGAGTIYDLLTAQAKYESAVSKLINTKYELLEAIYYMKYVKGEVK